MGTLVDSLKPVGSMTRSSVADGVSFQEEIIGPLTENRNLVWNYLSQFDFADLSNVSASAAAAYQLYSKLSSYMPGNEITVDDILLSAESGASAYLAVKPYNLNEIKSSAELGYRAYDQVAPYASKFAGMQGSAQSGQLAFNSLAAVKSNWTDVENNAKSGQAANDALTTERKSNYEYLIANYATISNSAKSAASTYDKLYNSSTGMFGKWNSVHKTITASGTNYTNAFTGVTSNSSNWDKLVDINGMTGNWNKVYTYMKASATLLNNARTSLSSNSGTKWNATVKTLTAEGYKSGTDVSCNSAFWTWMSEQDISVLDPLTASDLSTKQTNWNAAYNGIANAGNWNNAVTYAKSASLWNSVKSYNFDLSNSSKWNSMYTYAANNSALLSSTLMKTYDANIEKWKTINSELTKLTALSSNTASYNFMYGTLYNKSLNAKSANWQWYDAAYTNAALATAFVSSLSALSGDWNKLTAGKPTRAQLESMTAAMKETDWNTAYKTYNDNYANWDTLYAWLYDEVIPFQGGKFHYSRYSEFTKTLINDKWSRLSGKADDYVRWDESTTTGTFGNWIYKLTFGPDSAYINSNKSNFNTSSWWTNSAQKTKMNETRVNRKTAPNGKNQIRYIHRPNSPTRIKTSYSGVNSIYLI